MKYVHGTGHAVFFTADSVEEANDKNVSIWPTWTISYLEDHSRTLNAPLPFLNQYILHNHLKWSLHFDTVNKTK